MMGLEKMKRLLVFNMYSPIDRTYYKQIKLLRVGYV